MKTIAAYRGGLDRVSEHVVTALEANESTGDPLPVQVHCGFGDWDLHLWRADPGYLKPLLERFGETTFVLLHCYPFVREAGWLAHVYGNVYFDLSLTIPHVARPVEALQEALELAPLSKLLYASDAARTPELYLLAATWWRDALASRLRAVARSAVRRLRDGLPREIHSRGASMRRFALAVAGGVVGFALAFNSDTLVSVNTRHRGLRRLLLPRLRFDVDATDLYGVDGAELSWRCRRQ